MLIGFQISHNRARNEQKELLLNLFEMLVIFQLDTVLYFLIEWSSSDANRFLN